MAVVLPLSTNHDRKSFDCGNEDLNRFLRELAGQYHRKDLASVYVLTPSADHTEIMGYFTLSSLSLSFAQTPEKFRKKLPQNLPLPFTLLGRLAVDQNHSGKGYGKTLLVKALSYVLESRIASLGVVVDAKDEAASLFYQRFGFIPFEHASNRLFLGKNDLRKWVG